MIATCMVETDDISKKCLELQSFKLATTFGDWIFKVGLIWWIKRMFNDFRPRKNNANWNMIGSYQSTVTKATEDPGRHIQIWQEQVKTFILPMSVPCPSFEAMCQWECVEKHTMSGFESNNTAYVTSFKWHLFKKNGRKWATE